MHSNGKLVFDSKCQAKSYTITKTHSKAKQTALVPYLPQSPDSEFIQLNTGCS